MKHNVLLDTSFFVRLVHTKDEWHQHAKAYYRYFLEKEIGMVISTISVAEYCVRGRVEELPMRHLQVLPFNVSHAQKTGTFAHILFAAQASEVPKITPRILIPNDAKLFAQADDETSISYFVTSDSRSKQTFQRLCKHLTPRFGIIDLTTPLQEAFGELF